MRLEKSKAHIFCHWSKARRRDKKQLNEIKKKERRKHTCLCAPCHIKYIKDANTGLLHNYKLNWWSARGTESILNLALTLVRPLAKSTIQHKQPKPWKLLNAWNASYIAHLNSHAYAHTGMRKTQGSKQASKQTSKHSHKLRSLKLDWMVKSAEWKRERMSDRERERRRCEEKKKLDVTSENSFGRTRTNSIRSEWSSHYSAYTFVLIAGRYTFGESGKFPLH